MNQDVDTILDNLKPVINELANTFELPSLSVAAVDFSNTAFYATSESETVNEHSLYGIGSISKAITVLGLSSLDNEVAISDPINHYLKNIKTDISILDIVTHQVDSPAFASTMPAFLGVAPDSIYKALDLTRKSSKKQGQFNYQNGTYWVLAKIIEAVTKKNWDNYISNKVLQPLQMYDTTLHAERLNTTQPYVRHQQQRRLIADSPFANSVAPAGGYYSTASDLSKLARYILGFDKCNIDPREAFNNFEPIVKLSLNPSSGDLIKSQYDSIHYSNGYFITNLIEPNTSMLNFVGGVPGYSALVSCLPKYGVAIVLLTNEMNCSKLLEYIAVEFARLSCGLELLSMNKSLYKQMLMNEKSLFNTLPTTKISTQLPSTTANRYLRITDRLYGEVELATDAAAGQIAFIDLNKKFLLNYDHESGSFIVQNSEQTLVFITIIPRIYIDLDGDKLSWRVFMNNRQGGYNLLEERIFG